MNYICAMTKDEMVSAIKKYLDEYAETVAGESNYEELLGWKLFWLVESSQINDKEFVFGEIAYDYKLPSHDYNEFKFDFANEAMEFDNAGVIFIVIVVLVILLGGLL